MPAGSSNFHEEQLGTLVNYLHLNLPPPWPQWGFGASPSQVALGSSGVGLQGGISKWGPAAGAKQRPARSLPAPRSPGHSVPSSVSAVWQGYCPQGAQGAHPRDPGLRSMLFRGVFFDADIAGISETSAQLLLSEPQASAAEFTGTPQPRADSSACYPHIQPSVTSCPLLPSALSSQVLASLGPSLAPQPLTLVPGLGPCPGTSSLPHPAPSPGGFAGAVP